MAGRNLLPLRSLDYFWLGSEEDGSTSWCESGLWCPDGKTPNSHDLVAERRDPPISKTITVYLTRDGERIYTNHAELGFKPINEIIAQKTITITEGEGV